MAFSSSLPPEYAAIEAELPPGARLMNFEISRDHYSGVMEVQLDIRMPTGSDGTLRFAISEMALYDGRSNVALIAEQVGAWFGREVKKPEPPEVKKLDEHIIGFRLWRIGKSQRQTPFRGSAPTLIPIFHTSPRQGWQGAEWVRAVGDGCPHMYGGDVPAPYCHCGWNCFHEPAGAHRQYAGEMGDEDIVMGAVLAKGRMEVHWEGFRCEWAKPIGLVARDFPGLARLESAEDLVAFALEHGSAIPSDLRPERGAFDPYMGHHPGFGGRFRLGHGSGLSYGATAALPYRNTTTYSIPHI